MNFPGGICGEAKERNLWGNLLELVPCCSRTQHAHPSWGLSRAPGMYLSLARLLLLQDPWGPAYLFQIPRVMGRKAARNRVLVLSLGFFFFGCCSMTGRD